MGRRSSKRLRPGPGGRVASTTDLRSAAPPSRRSVRGEYQAVHYGMRRVPRVVWASGHVYAHQEASVTTRCHSSCALSASTTRLCPRSLPPWAGGMKGEWDSGLTRPHFMEGHEFVTWRGLDGTEVLCTCISHDKNWTIHRPGDECSEKLRCPIHLSRPRHDLDPQPVRWPAQGHRNRICSMSAPERSQTYPAAPCSLLHELELYSEGVQARKSYRAQTGGRSGCPAGKDSCISLALNSVRRAIHGVDLEEDPGPHNITMSTGRPPLN